MARGILPEGLENRGKIQRYAASAPRASSFLETGQRGPTLKGTAVMDETPMEVRGTPLDFDALVVPALAQEKEEDVRVIVHGPGRAPMPPMPPLPPEPLLAPPSFGIPPEVAAKIGLPQNLVQKVQDLSFEANEALIGLEADLIASSECRRAHTPPRRPLPSPGRVSMVPGMDADKKHQMRDMGPKVTLPAPAPVQAGSGK
jgi:hypothetical protein